MLFNQHQDSRIMLIVTKWIFLCDCRMTLWPSHKATVVLKLFTMVNIRASSRVQIGANLYWVVSLPDHFKEFCRSFLPHCFLFFSSFLRNLRLEYKAALPWHCGYPLAVLAEHQPSLQHRQQQVLANPPVLLGVESRRQLFLPGSTLQVRDKKENLM